jgi:uracil-DNA glycosylase
MEEGQASTSLRSALPQSWDFLSEFISEDLEQFYQTEINSQIKIFPPFNEIFSIYEQIEPSQVRVVIIGQDPYFSENQAHGVSFSVNKGIKVPSSLRNIYKEIENCHNHGNLQSNNVMRQDTMRQDIQQVNIWDLMETGNVSLENISDEASASSGESKMNSDETEDVLPEIVDYSTKIYDSASSCQNGYLKPLVDQGVFMMNCVLTVRNALPNSHRGHGWEQFSNETINTLAKTDRPLVFLLWGSHAQNFKPSIELFGQGKHCIVTSSHPSGLSAHKTREPFIGSQCFKRANEFLAQNNLSVVDWMSVLEANR